MHFNAFVFAALPVLAAATAVPRNDGQCMTGDPQCCQNTQTNTITNLLSAGGLAGLLLPSVAGLIGLTCSPITVIGGSGISCSAQPVCCTNNSFNGVVALGCTPINLNL